MDMARKIRQAGAVDEAALKAVKAAQGAAEEAGYFARCLQEQAAGKRIIFLVEGVQENTVSGYAQLIWRPVYAPFRRFDIPEIQDLNVVPDARRQGLGAALVARCEEAARAAKKTEIGIGVGLVSYYGAAQRLYVAAGYVPDGNGVVCDEIPVCGGEIHPVDDLVLKLTKRL